MRSVSRVADRSVLARGTMSSIHRHSRQSANRRAGAARTPHARHGATTSPCRDTMADVSAATSKPESPQQSKAKRSRSALGRARRLALEAPRPALRATVARRLRSGRARPAVTHRPGGSIHQLGSPRVVVRVRAGANGAAEATTVRKIDYDEFGNQTVTWNTGAISDRALPIGFAGGLYDQDTGFVHFGAS